MFLKKALSVFLSLYLATSTTVAVHSSERPIETVEEDIEKKLPYEDVLEGSSVYHCWESGCFDLIPLGTRFQEDVPATRGFFITAASALLNPVLENSDPYYQSSVEWATAEGIVNGYSDGDFHAGDYMTRQTMCQVLSNMASWLGYDTTPTDSFRFAQAKDSETCNLSTRKSVKWCLQNGFIELSTDSMLQPTEVISRGQVADALYRFSCYTKETLLPTISPISCTAPILNTESHRTLMASIQEIAKKYGAMGLSVAYIKDGVVQDTFSTGAAVVGIQNFEAETKYRVASISKILVGLAAIISAERGTMDLDADLSQYLGFQINPKISGDVITARSILTHSSSLVVQGEGVSGDYDTIRRLLTSGSGIRRVTSGNPSNWAYNNYALYVLGVAVERANHQTLNELLYEELFSKLNIDASFYGGELKDSTNLANVYRSNGAVGLSVQTQRNRYSSEVPGADGTVFAGGLIISAYDLGKIIAVLANDGMYDGEHILSPSVIAQLEAYKPQMISGGFYQAQPLRYREWMYGESSLYYHTGSAYGAYNLISYNPNTGEGVVVLTSGASGAKDNYGVYAICGEISKLLYQQTLK